MNFEQGPPTASAALAQGEVICKRWNGAAWSPDAPAASRSIDNGGWGIFYTYLVGRGIFRAAPTLLSERAALFVVRLTDRPKDGRLRAPGSTPWTCRCSRGSAVRCKNNFGRTRP